jgi:hypothetical protein
MGVSAARAWMRVCICLHVCSIYACIIRVALAFLLSPPPPGPAPRPLPVANPALRGRLAARPASTCPARPCALAPLRPQPDNLLMADPRDNAPIKLCDWGFASVSRWPAQAQFQGPTRIRGSGCFGGRAVITWQPAALLAWDSPGPWLPVKAAAAIAEQARPTDAHARVLHHVNLPKHALTCNPSHLIHVRALSCPTCSSSSRARS